MFSAKINIVAAAVFAVICFSFALSLLFSVSVMTDPTHIAEAKGYAGFWAFLGLIGTAVSILTHWLIQTQDSDKDS